MKSNTFVIPAGQNQFIREDNFNSEPIRRVVIAMCPNNIFSGMWNNNPLQFGKQKLRMVRLFRNGVPIVEHNTQDNTQVNYKTLQSLHFDRDGPEITLDNYANHFYLVFDLTSTQQCDHDVYYPEIVGAPIKLELEFSEPTANPLEFFVVG